MYNTMSFIYRHGLKWNVNELLSLQREYELLEMTIQDIANKHQRSIESILYRLQQEGFIETWIDARGYQEYSKTLPYLAGSLDSGDYNEEDDNETDDKDSDYLYDEEEDDAEISNLNQHVWRLETAVSDIKKMINTLLVKVSSISSNVSSVI